MKRSYGRGEQPAISISPRIESRWGTLKATPGSSGRSCTFPDKIRADKSFRAKRKAGMDITWVTDRIAVGGGIWNADNMAAVARAGITHVIDMQIEFDDTPLARPHGIEVCWNPIDDDFAPKPAEVFERGVEFAVAALEGNEAKLFIHCAAGVHRAPMMTLALLGVMGWSVDDAMVLIEGRRPVADFAEVYVRSVEKYLKGRS